MRCYLRKNRDKAGDNERMINYEWPIYIIFYLGFLSRTFTIYRIAEEGEAVSLTHLYQFQPLHRHLDISRAITAESSHLHIASNRTRTGNLWFPSASR